MSKNFYYSVSKVMSFAEIILYFIIGERGVGKTFSFKDFCIKHYFKKKKKFVWLRRYNSDLISAIGDENNLNFFKDIKINYKGYEFDIKKDGKGKVYYLYVNNINVGYAMDLRSAESLKGTTFDDVDTIIFDEFLVGDGGSRYLKNEPMYLLSILETIGRLRPIKCFCLGNATSTINPYFDFFKIKLNPNKEISLYKNNTILVQYIKNEAYREAKKDTGFGRLISGTKYEDYAIENKFVNDNDDFIKKRTPKSKLFFRLQINNEIYGVWLDKREMYISTRHYDNGILFALDSDNHDSKTILLRRRSVFMQNIKKHFEMGLLFFENQNIKYHTIDILRRYGII